MKTRPWSLVLYAWVLLGITASFYIQIVVVHEHSLLDFNNIMGRINFLNKVIIVLCVGTAYLAFHASHWLMFSTPFLVCTVLWNNFIAMSVGQEFNPTTVFAASLAFVVLQGLLFLPSVRLVLKNQEMRWWQHSQRRAVALPVRVAARGRGFTTATFDMSLTGAFLVSDTEEKISDEDAPDLALGELEHVNLVFNPDTEREIPFRAQVIRIDERKGIYPGGIGIRFFTLGWNQRRQLKALLVPQLPS